MIESIIVEDDPKSADILKKHIADFCPNVKVSGIADNIKDAIELIDVKKPQLVFLDIEIKDGTSFDLLKQLNGAINFEIIFITAFNNYAIEAINFSASAYLMKPVDEEELMEAVNKVKGEY